jgi:hypothetical protein
VTGPTGSTGPVHLPPGWPREVLPPGAAGFEESATAWLLDQCPPEYRAHPVFRRHLVVLVRAAAHHVAGAVEGGRAAYRSARTELAGLVPADVVEQALQAYEAEGSRLVSVSRQVGLVEDAVRGRRYVPRM